MIRTLESRFSVRMMCGVLGVSASGYYAAYAREASPTAQARDVLDAKVRGAFEAEKGRAGSPRVVQRLKAQSPIAGRHQVAQSMARQGLRAKAACKYKATTNSKHSLPVADNLLQQTFQADRPSHR